MYYNDFIKSFKNFESTYNEVQDFIDKYEKEDKERILTEIRKLDNLSDYNRNSYTELYSSDIQAKYKRLNSNLRKETANLFEENIKLSEQQKALISKLDANESAINSAIEKAIVSQVGKVTIGQENLEFIKNIQSGDEKALLQLVANNSADFNDFYTEVGDVYNMYESTKKNIELLTSIDIQELIKNPSIDSLFSHGNKIVNVLEKYPGTSTNAAIFKENLNDWEKSYKQARVLINNVTNLSKRRITAIKNCIEEPSCECLKELMKKNWYTDAISNDPIIGNQTIPKNIQCEQLIKIKNSLETIIKEDPSPKDLMELGDVFAQYSTNEKRNEWNDLKVLIKDTQDFIHKDSIRLRFRKIGSMISKKLPPEYKDEWDKLLIEGKIDITGIILETYNSNDKEFFSWLNNLLLYQNRNEISDFDQVIFELVYKYMLHNSKEEVILQTYSLFIKHFHKDIAPFLDLATWQEIKKYIQPNGIFNDADFAKDLELSNDGLIIKGQSFEFNHNKIVKSLNRLQLRPAKVDLLRRLILAELLKNISNNSIEILSEIELNAPQLSELIRRSDIDLHAVTASTIHNNEILKKETKNELIGELYYRKNREASVIKQTETLKRVSTHAIIPVNEERQNSISSSSTAMKEQMAVMALDYAFPGAGMAVNVVKNLFDSYDNINEINKNTADQLAISKQIIRKLVEIEQNKIQELIFEKEKKIAEMQMKIASLKEDKYSKLEERAYDESLNARTLLSEFALKRLFYHSEILKRDYFLLDKSIRFWLGKSIKELVLFDKDNYPYCYDPEIDMITWFDKSKEENSRTDIDYNYQYWKNIKTVVLENVRTLFQRGDYFEVIPDYYTLSDLESFTNTKISEKNSKLVFNLQEFIKAQSPEFYNRNLNNFRVIDLRMNGKEKDGTFRGFADPMIALENNGNGKLLNNGKVEYQNLAKVKVSGGGLSSKISTHPDFVQSDILEDFKENWFINSNNPFNGYAVDSDWTLSFSDRFFKKFSTKNVTIAFAFTATKKVIEEDINLDYNGILLAPNTNQAGSIYLDNNQLKALGVKSGKHLEDLYKLYNSEAENKINANINYNTTANSLTYELETKDTNHE